MFNLFHKARHNDDACFILPLKHQVKAWRRANRRMKWGIGDAEFAKIGAPPSLTAQDRADGFISTVLSYGFGDDGHGHADAVLSGKVAWAYAQKHLRRKTWQCQYIDLEKVDNNYPLFGIPTLRFS